eukprot:1854602-Amphidinium_carterae.1
MTTAIATQSAQQNSHKLVTKSALRAGFSTSRTLRARLMHSGQTLALMSHRATLMSTWGSWRQLLQSCLEPQTVDCLSAEPL